MASLIFCSTGRSMESWGEELTKRGAEEPFMMKSGRDIIGAIEALKAGRHVIAHAGPATATGWRAPEGTVIVLDDDLANASDPGRRALAEQVRSRVSNDGMRLYPHQLRAIEAIKGLDRDELSERLSHIGFRMQRESRVFRVGRPSPEVRTVSLEGVMKQIDAKRDAMEAGRAVSVHDLEEGLSRVNEAETAGTLIIAVDRFDAYIEIRSRDRVVNIDSPDKTEAARDVMSRGGVAVAAYDMLAFGIGKATNCEVQLTERAWGHAGAARAALHLCRERMSRLVRDAGIEEPSLL